MVLTLLLILLLLVLSASFSSLETALFSLTPLEKHRLRTGSGLSDWIVPILEKPRELLMTVLFGNELVNVGISILAGGLAYDLFRTRDVRLVYLLTIAVTTFILLVFGEILPKNLAIRNRVVVSQALVLPFRVFAWFVTPFRVVLTRVADRLVALFGAESKRRMIFEEELRTILEMGRQEGTLADFERTLIQNAIDFSVTPISKVMTPREKIAAIPDSFSLKEILEMFQENSFSRIPVYRENLDQILGILYAKELIHFKVSPGDGGTILPLLKPYAELQPDETLSQVFEKFRERRIHIGIVKERGQVVGLVTMDTLLRRLFP